MIKTCLERRKLLFIVFYIFFKTQISTYIKFSISYLTLREGYKVRKKNYLEISRARARGSCHSPIWSSTGRFSSAKKKGRREFPFKEVVNTFTFTITIHKRDVAQYFCLRDSKDRRTQPLLVRGSFGKGWSQGRPSWSWHHSGEITFNCVHGVQYSDVAGFVIINILVTTIYEIRTI